MAITVHLIRRRGSRTYVPPVEPPDPGIRDSFDRPDSPTLGTTDTGQPWTEHADWQIAGGKASNVLNAAVEGAERLATVDAGTANVALEVTFTWGGASAFSGLVLRHQDDSNYLLLQHETSSQNWRLYKKVAGGFTMLIQSEFGSWRPAGSPQLVKVTANGSALELFLDGTSRGTATDPVFSDKTAHGLRLWHYKTGTSDTWDDFSITPLASPYYGLPA